MKAGSAKDPVSSSHFHAKRVEGSEQRDFRQYLASTFLATIAMMIQSVAVAWQVYDLVREPLALGYVGLFQFLPLALFALPAGALADHLDRRALLAATYLLQTLSSLLFVAMALAPPQNIWPFYAVLALFGTARAFAAPASQSLLPRLVTEERFPRSGADVVYPPDRGDSGPGAGRGDLSARSRDRIWHLRGLLRRSCHTCSDAARPRSFDAAARGIDNARPLDGGHRVHLA